MAKQLEPSSSHNAAFGADATKKPDALAHEALPLEARIACGAAHRSPARRLPLRGRDRVTRPIVDAGSRHGPGCRSRNAPDRIDVEQQPGVSPPLEGER